MHPVTGFQVASVHSISDFWAMLASSHTVDNSRAPPRQGSRLSLIRTVGATTSLTILSTAPSELSYEVKISFMGPLEKAPWDGASTFSIRRKKKSTRPSSVIRLTKRTRGSQEAAPKKGAAAYQSAVSFMAMTSTRATSSARAMADRKTCKFGRTAAISLAQSSR